MNDDEKDAKTFLQLVLFLENSDGTFQIVKIDPLQREIQKGRGFKVGEIVKEIPCVY